MSLSKEEVNMYLKQRVELKWKNPKNERILDLIGIVKLVTPENVTLDSSRFGKTTVPLTECLGIREDKEVIL